MTQLFEEMCNGDVASARKVVIDGIWDRVWSP